MWGSRVAVGVVGGVLVASGCATASPPHSAPEGVSNEAACEAPSVEFTPHHAVPGDMVTVTLGAMATDCYDTGQGGQAPPIAAVMTVSLVALDNEKTLVSVDVPLDAGNSGEAEVAIPEAAPPGEYTASLSPAPVEYEVYSTLTVGARD